jgi:hypothetical protein
VSRESPFLDPAIYRILGHPKMGGHIIDADPAFFCGHFIPLLFLRQMPIKTNET